ncbi:hypothetical protein [Ensifer canadensis]
MPKPFKTMLAPPLAKALAMARPMPLVEPVMTAVLVIPDLSLCSAADLARFLRRNSVNLRVKPLR